MSRRVTFDQLARELSVLVPSTEIAAVKGIRSGARRALARLNEVTPVVTGRLRGSQGVEDQTNGANIVALAPYSGIVDHRGQYVGDHIDEIHQIVATETARVINKERPQ